VAIDVSMELRTGREVEAPKGPTNGSPAYRGMKTRGIRTYPLSTIEPGGVDHQQRFQKIGGPPLGVHSVTVILIFLGLPKLSQKSLDRGRLIAPCGFDQLIEPCVPGLGCLRCPVMISPQTFSS